MGSMDMIQPGSDRPADAEEVSRYLETERQHIADDLAKGLTDLGMDEGQAREYADRHTPPQPPERYPESPCHAVLASLAETTGSLRDVLGDIDDIAADLASLRLTLSDKTPEDMVSATAEGIGVPVSAQSLIVAKCGHLALAVKTFDDLADALHNQFSQLATKAQLEQPGPPAPRIVERPRSDDSPVDLDEGERPAVDLDELARVVEGKPEGSRPIIGFRKRLLGS